MPDRLTVRDLNRTLADPRHLGFGYASTTTYGLTGARRDRLDRAVVAVANELGLDYEALFAWSNSKFGRWLADDVYGCGAPPTRTTVRKLLNRRAIAEVDERAHA